MRLIFALFALLIFGTVFAERLDPLPPEEAFVFSATATSDGVQVVYAMPEDLYLYRTRFSLTTATPGFSVKQVDYPPGIWHDDLYFGKMEVYYGLVTLRAQIAGEGEFNLVVISQGCDEQLGICYPPREDTALLRVADGQLSLPSSTPTANDAAPADEAAAAAAVVGDNLWRAIIVFFGFGLLLAFTPCVLPMIPVLLGVISGGARERRRVMALTIAYIIGVCVTFTVLGVIAGLSGQLLSATLQQPPVLAVSALIFVALALSLFGWYDLQAPAFLRNRLAKSGTGSIGGAVAMGAFSAVVVSPCVAAPLVGALIYIGNTGDAFGGGVSLFALSLGMSVPLIIAGATAGAALPKAGEWMNDIKRILGALMLGAAVWVASSLLFATVVVFLYGAVLILIGIFMRVLEPLPAAAGSVARIVKALGVLSLLWGSAMVIGAASGSRDSLAPLSHWRSDGAIVSVTALDFLPVQSENELQKAINAAGGRLVMLEVYADWCVSCKEMERFTFSNEQVQKKISWNV